MPDVSEFDELISTSKSQTASLLKEFEQFVYSNFDNFDLDKDGYLSKEELEAAIFEKNRTVKEVSILNFSPHSLKRNRRQLRRGGSGQRPGLHFKNGHPGVLFQTLIERHFEGIQFQNNAKKHGSEHQFAQTRSLMALR